MNHLHTLDIIAGVLLIIGGLNWLLVGLFEIDVVSRVLMVTLARVVFVIVGIAAVYTIVRLRSLYHIGGKAHTPPQTPAA